MTAKPRIAVIVGSTRPTRFADVPSQWILQLAQARGDMEVELVDLRDHPLPLFDEMASNRWMPSQSPEAVRWQQTLARFDGFIFVVAEYNHSITGVLKNALDQAYREWEHKPFTAIGYGGVGATRAVEHLRGIGVELQMVSTRSAVHIGGGDFMAIHPFFGNQPIETIEANLIPSATAALDELVWWAKATMAARAVGCASIAVAHGTDVRAVRGQLEREAGRRRRALAALRDAIDAEATVLIGYVDNQGVSSERIVDPVRVDGGWLTARDHRADDVRQFAVHRIRTVNPVDSAP